MAHSTPELAHLLLTRRRQHPAWQILAAKRAPLVLSCLKPLMEQASDGIAMEDAQQQLTHVLQEFANHPEFEVEPDAAIQARRELRVWITRGLLTERSGRYFATDALQSALSFLESLTDRVMTSSASRLATVQREIENLATALDMNPQSRAQQIKRKIARLEEELAAVEAGDIPVLNDASAMESIQEVYQLSMTLRADFRRVEDSYRIADRELRQSILSEQNHRGEIVDKLLNSHDDLLQTPEGQVFHGFYEQLNRSRELEDMKTRLREILQNASADRALSRQQKHEMRYLVTGLVSESRSVIEARARSEGDVKGYLKTGLAAEHHRVGQILNELLETALNIDWSNTALRRSATPLPPVAVSAGSMPVVERLRFKEIADSADQELELASRYANLDELDAEFWEAFDSLDEQQLQQDTLRVLQQANAPLSLAELACALPPSHDLETLSWWLQAARDAQLPLLPGREQIDLVGPDGKTWRFDVPNVQITQGAIADFEAGVPHG